MNETVNIPQWVWLLLGGLAWYFFQAFMQLLLAPLLSKLRSINPQPTQGTSVDSHCLACKESIDRRIADLEKRLDSRIDRFYSHIDEEIRRSK